MSVTIAFELTPELCWTAAILGYIIMGWLTSFVFMRRYNEDNHDCRAIVAVAVWLMWPAVLLIAVIGGVGWVMWRLADTKGG